MAQAGTLDTHRMVKQLVGSGMGEPQAEAVVDLIKRAHDEVVTREVLRYELSVLEERIATRFEGIATRFEAMDRRIDGAEERLGRRMDGLEGKLDTLGKDLTIRLGGMLAAAVAVVGTMVAIF